VGADGEVEPADGILLISGNGDQKDPRVAFNGGRYLVTYTDTSADAPRARATRVGLDGQVIDAGGFTLGAALGASRAPDVACNGTSFYVVFENRDGVYGQYVGSGGITGPAQKLADGAINPQIAWNGSQYLAVWNQVPVELQDGPATDLDIAARIIHADATPAAVTVVTTAPGNQEQPSVAGGAGRFLISWHQDGALVAQLHGEGGQPVVFGRSIVGRPALAGNSHGFVMSWTARVDEEVRVLGAALDGSLKPTSSWISIRLPMAGDDDADDKRPAISLAGDGEYAMVTWQDHVASGATTLWARPTMAQDPFLLCTLPD
jgi:hypothetical protein